MANLDKPLDLNQVNGYLMSLMVLQKAEANNELDPYFKGIADKLGKNGQSNAPIELLSKSFSPENTLDIKLQYPDYWEQIHSEVKAVDMSAKLATAGYTADEIESLPIEVLQHFATVDTFQDHFPAADKDEGLLARLANGKEALFDALNSDGGKKALTAISLGISIGTGAIVTRMAIKGGAWVAGQIIANESVQDFASKMQTRMGSFLERMGVPTGTIAQKFSDFKENAKGVMASETFQRYGKPSLALAGIAFGAMMLGDFNHDKVVDLATNGFNKSMDLASAGVDLGVQGAHAANEGIKAAGETILEYGSKAAGLAVDAGVAAVDSVAEFGSDAATAVSGGFGTTGEFIADTAVGAYRAAVGGIVVAGQGLIHGAEAGVELLSDGAGYVAETAKAATVNTVEALGSASEYVTSAASGAVESGRHFVGDGLNTVGEHIKGAGEVVAGVTPEVPHDELIAGTDDITSVYDEQQVTANRAPEVPTTISDSNPVYSGSDVSPAGQVSQQMHHIEKGESLWKIAKEQFALQGVDATNGQILEATKSLYEANKDLIGSNPDLIFAGNDLRVDPALFAPQHVADVPVLQAAPEAVPSNELSDLSKMLGGAGSFPSSMVFSEDQAHQIVESAGIGKVVEQAVVTSPKDVGLQAKIDAILSDKPAFAAPDQGSFKDAVQKITAKPLDFTPPTL